MSLLNAQSYHTISSQRREALPWHLLVWSRTSTKLQNRDTVSSEDEQADLTTCLAWVVRLSQWTGIHLWGVLTGIFFFYSQSIFWMETCLAWNMRQKSSYKPSRSGLQSSPIWLPLSHCQHNALFYFHHHGWMAKPSQTNLLHACFLYPFDCGCSEARIFIAQFTGRFRPWVSDAHSLSLRDPVIRKAFLYTQNSVAPLAPASANLYL